MRISDWSSDVCSSDLHGKGLASGEPSARTADNGRFCAARPARRAARTRPAPHPQPLALGRSLYARADERREKLYRQLPARPADDRRRHRRDHRKPDGRLRSEEHTSELQSLMRISYAVFCLKKKITTTHNTHI